VLLGLPVVELPEGGDGEVMRTSCQPGGWTVTGGDAESGLVVGGRVVELGLGLGDGEGGKEMMAGPVGERPPHLPVMHVRLPQQLTEEVQL
jgi:hypothetical protein